MEASEKIKCFAYLRVSGIEQVEGDGFTRQLLACQSYAEKNNLEIVGVFREEGVSGTKELDNRPALLELVLALRRDAITTILIEKLDRLSRDLLVQETIIGDMLEQNYTLISTQEPDLCSSDPSRVLVRQIFGAISQYDRAIIVSRLRGARDRKRALTGKCEGRLFYGQKRNETKYLAYMLELRRGGYTYKAIKDIMNKNGVPSREGGKWHTPVVWRMVSRELQKQEQGKSIIFGSSSKSNEKRSI